MAEPEGEELLELPVDAPPEEPADDEEKAFVYDEDLDNLCFAFDGHPTGKEALKDIGAKVEGDFDDAWDGHEEYRERFNRDWKLFSGDLAPKEEPWKACANTNVPIMIQNVMRIQFRMKSELFGDWSETFHYKPLRLDPTNVEAAQLMTIHDNWQFRQQISDFSRQQDRGLLAFLVAGDVTCHSFRDDDLEENRHEILTTDEFVTPYVFVSTRPDYSDVPYRVKVLHRFRHQLEAKRGQWFGIEEILDGDEVGSDIEGKPEPSLRISVAQTAGEDAPQTSANSSRKILLYEGWLEPDLFPGQKRSRFCQMHYDVDSQTVLQFRIHEKEDWRDRIRFDRETSELQAYQAASAQYEQMAAAYPQEREAYELAAFEAGHSASMMGMPLQQAQAMVPPPPDEPTPPPPPGWLAESADGQPRPIKTVPIHMFSHGVCIENLVGTSGLGYGRVQADLNRAANTAMSQYTDAASLGNSWGMITTDIVNLDRPIKIAPGRINQVKGISGEQLKANLIELKPSPANPQMMDIVKQNYEWGESSMAAPDVFSGAPGKSGETWRGQAARTEQATKQTSVLATGYARFFKQIVENNRELNSMFVDDNALVDVTHKGEPRQVRVSRELYRRGYQVEISSDLRFVAQSQKIMEATELVQMAGSYPPLQGNYAFAYEALKLLLEARNQHSLVAKLGPRPPDPQVPMGTPPPMPPGGPTPPGQPGAGAAQPTRGNGAQTRG